ncbi:pyrroline-5-carboxylate reductase [Leifsonia sp. 98AMF]|uniref:pyrroline-5-carboxylate reductase n=1 Tax=unclassified Leifsonia TaxID=2663824 RepID=UPI00087AE129|nr:MULTISPECIES: pyrroline-5-carboxylate reductase [unclassified Leifsonia]SDH05943.1 pyrroline-5-carboxylate reductase [Leifsonia sp. 197AMF]SDJ34487.1 pyrroline-5-carboxylate reductase [Leifsonia sp. 466MF]SDK45362.1 pyrroline-5-carboxylate reductase [Leifsonia sp. 157MF]SDN55312.1 pyrroline-5-carboxylate reductase [Leifsonia sp. 509MF]SEN54608.1 pyrroline-5-carboxylate reductase [Leifsonia sp. 467MF]
MDDAQNVTLPTIAMLGAGSMGRAILSGLLAPGVQVAGIRVTNRSEARAAELAGTPGVTAYATETKADANRLAVDGAQVVIVAVKPAMVRDLLAEITDSLAPGTVVVSVAAGVTTETMESLLPDSVSVVRAMPNTPAVVGKAVTGISAGSRTDPEDLQVVRALFETVGEVVEVPESQLDALSTISGSGPAYVFLLIEALTEAAVQKGFTPEQAATLVNGTFLGASELLVSSGEDPAELRRRVTSPNGTTERAIAVLSEADLPALFARATDAALARARELAAG